MFPESVPPVKNGIWNQWFWRPREGGKKTNKVLLGSFEVDFKKRFLLINVDIN